MSAKHVLNFMPKNDVRVTVYELALPSDSEVAI